MKKLFTCGTLAAIALLAGCRNLGYNDRSLSDSSTPNTSQREYVRSYDANGNPVVTPATPASTQDPASPNYSGPAR